MSKTFSLSLRPPERAERLAKDQPWLGRFRCSRAFRVFAGAEKSAHERTAKCQGIGNIERHASAVANVIESTTSQRFALDVDTA